MMWLTREEVAELTGYKLPSYQRRWLLKRGFKFEVNAAGLPIVARLEVERKMTGGKREPALNLSALGR